jgi:hypothetical protein
MRAQMTVTESASQEIGCMSVKDMDTFDTLEPVVIEGEVHKRAFL